MFDVQGKHKKAWNFMNYAMWKLRKNRDIISKEYEVEKIMSKCKDKIKNLVGRLLAVLY